MFISVLAFLAITYFIVLLVKHPHIRRMAIRRLWQNKTASFWTISGASIAIAMIASSMLLLHSVSTSVDKVVEERLGPIIGDFPADLQPSLQGGGFSHHDVQDITSKTSWTMADTWLPIVGLEGTLFSMDEEEGEVVNSLSSTFIFGFSKSEAQKLDRISVDLLPEKIADNEIVLSKTAADQLEVEPGANLYYFDGVKNIKLKVAAVVPEAGLTGYRGYRNAQATAIVHIDSARAWSVTAKDAYTNLLIGTSQPKKEDRSSLYIDAGAWEMVYVHALLENTLSGSTKLLPVFTIASLTALATAFALIFNVFKMIAVERKQEFGILRAIGMTRNDVKFLIRMEGFFYACMASIIGTSLGTGLAYLLLYKLNEVLENLMMLEEGIAVGYRFLPDVGILFGSFSLGVLIIGLSVFFLSMPIGSISIVEALKPHGQKHSHKKKTKVLPMIGLFLFMLTIWLFVFTRLSGFKQFLNDSNAILPLVVFGVAFVLVVLLICSVVFLLGPFVQGLLLLCRAFPKVYSALQMAFRYPLIQRVRTGLIITMFAFVMFLTSFSAIFSETMNGFFGKFDARIATGGYDLIANYPDRYTTEELRSLLEIAGENSEYVDTIVAVPGFDMPEFYNMRVHGVEQDFVKETAIPLVDFDSTFPNEQAVWEAVISNSESIIISDLALKYSIEDYELGDRYPIMVTDPHHLDSEPVLVEKTIIGIANVEDESHSYAAVRGVWTSMDSLVDMSENQVKLDTTLLIKVPNGINVNNAKVALEETLATHNLAGLENPKERFEAGTTFLRSFFTIFEGFNAMAIVIGLAGLMIVMLRVVKERRQTIGVLRSIGVSSENIYASIWTEGLFLGVTGTLIGLFAGSYSGILMIEAFMGSDGVEQELLAIQFPYLKLIIYFVGACLLSAVVSSVAARQAMKVSPVEATKYVS